jgi:peptidoglycan hydrolase-like protein with peptidoglycan-binding domain
VTSPAATTTATTPTTTHATTTHQTTTTTTPATTSGGVTLPASGKLKAGDTGPEVETLQKALVTIGAAPSLKVDGKYGPSTTAAVTAFQQSNGLTADGVVGKETAAAINAALAAHA